MIFEKSDLYDFIYYDYFLIDKIIKPGANILDDGDDDDNTGNPLRKLMRGRIEGNDYDDDDDDENDNNDDNDDDDDVGPIL